jgi:hypothetical protein
LATFFAKWGNLDENLLNGVISVKKLKIGGKNWNLLIFLFWNCWAHEKWIGPRLSKHKGVSRAKFRQQQ